LSPVVSATNSIPSQDCPC